MPRTRSRPRPATPTRTRSLNPRSRSRRAGRRAGRAGRHRRAGPGPGAGDPGLDRQAVPDPLRVDGADPRRRPAGPGQPLPLPLHRPVDRRHRRLPPAGRRRQRAPSAASAARAGARPARSRPQSESSQNFIKRIVAGPGRHAQRSADGHPVVNGVEKTDEPYISPCGSGRRLQFAEADHHSTRPLLHDGRQPWGKRRQPLLGPVPRDWIIGKAFATYWPPDRIGDLLRPRQPTGAGWRGRRRLFAFDRGARQPLRRRRRRGRARLPRRAAGRRRGADRLRGALARRPPRARRPARLQADDRGAARRSCTRACCGRPSGSASSSAARAGSTRRGLHVTNIEALSQRAGAAGGRTPRRPASSTASRCRDCAVPHRRGDRGRRDERRDRRRLGDRQGHPRPLHARRRRRSTPAGASRSTSATRPPSTARRSSGSASRRCTAARSSRSPTRQLELAG